jgi:hypothetical protein
MPLVIHPRVRKVAMRVAATTSLAMFATTGAALASPCTPPPVSKALARAGDTASYFPAPGGTFEGTASEIGWSLNNASLTAGNDPFDLNSSDSQSLTINSGGSAQSPFFCIDSTMPFFRFAAQQVTRGSGLRVALVVRFGNYTPSLGLSELADGSVSSWSLVNPISMTRGIPFPAGQHLQVALRFSVPSSGGAWQIDDVYVDPYRLG